VLERGRNIWRIKDHPLELNERNEIKRRNGGARRSYTWKEQGGMDGGEEEERGFCSGKENDKGRCGGIAGAQVGEGGIVVV
jgi:hypothetical protein